MYKTLRTWLPVLPLLLALAALSRGQPGGPGPDQPAEEKPAAVTPAEEKPDTGKPAEDKPAEEKPAEAKPPEEKPAEPKPAEEKPAEPKTLAVPDSDNYCIQCHETLTDQDQKRFFVKADDLLGDIHWKKGLRCQDCHGGDPTVGEIKAHQAKGDFRAVKSPADIPELCGTCHANIEYMKRYLPSPRTDQLAEYHTSGHGKALKQGDMKVATCISCHDKPHGSGADPTKHGIRTVDDLQSPVYRTNVGKTCSTCHSDQELMAGRQYHGRDLGHDQYERWKKSVHGEALLKKGDLSAPTCNNCHGNHGALPPQITSVANACGTCHGKVASLFAQAEMKHKFEEAGLPGCATCHQAHDIGKPSDKMLGMSDTAVCLRCHAQGKFGATLAGAEAARKLRADLDDLNAEIDTAKDTIHEAERLGMEVSGPSFDLRKAADALTNARSQIHTFKVAPVEKALAEGHAVVGEVQERADHALQEYTNRRIWLGATLVPIVVVILVLLAYIRTLPVPKQTVTH